MTQLSEEYIPKIAMTIHAHPDDQEFSVGGTAVKIPVFATVESEVVPLPDVPAHRRINGRTLDVARKYGVSDKTISNWRRKFGNMQSDDVRQLKQLEDENSRLKRLVARQAYDIECLKEVNAKKW